jgi:hypothetical protein
MAYGKIKADTIIYDNSGSDVEKLVSELATAAPTGSPTFTGTVTIPTPTSGDNSTKAASTAFVVAGFTAKPASAGTVAASEVVQVDANKDTTGIRNLTISGNLQVNGTTTTVASSTMTVADKNIEIAQGAANDAAADGGGITLKSGDGDKTWNWVDATDAWTSSEHIHLGDTPKLLLGTDQDAEINHNGSNLFIQNTTGNININPKANETAILCAPDGTVELYHDNTKKFETTTTGVTVTGAVTASTDVVDSKGNLRDIPQNTQTSAYTLVGGDTGKHIYISSGGVTVPASVYGAGNAVTIINNSGSAQTITQGSGLTMYNTADAATGNRTLAGRGICTILFINASACYVSGSGLT